MQRDSLRLRGETEIHSVCLYEGGILKINVRLCQSVICSLNVQTDINALKSQNLIKTNCNKLLSDILDKQQAVFSFYMR